MRITFVDLEQYKGNNTLKVCLTKKYLGHACIGNVHIFRQCARILILNIAHIRLQAAKLERSFQQYYGRGILNGLLLAV